MTRRGEGARFATITSFRSIRWLPPPSRTKPRIAKDQLKSIIERIVRLEEQKKAISDRFEIFTH